MTSPTTLTHGTMLDFARLHDPDGSLPVIAELLMRKNPLMNDLIQKPTNMAESHKVTVRTGIPTPTLRKFYKGVSPSKSSTSQLVFNTAQVVSWLEVDADEAKQNGMQAAWFFSEADAHIEGITRKVTEQMLYGDQATENGIIGLTSFYSTPSSSLDAAGYNMVNGGSTSAAVNTSFWLIKHDPANFFGLFPKEMPSGLQVSPVQPCELRDSDNLPFDGLRQKFSLSFGLCPKNWKNAVRMCNVNVADMCAGTGTLASQVLLGKMIQMTERLDSLDGAVLYVPRKASIAIRLMILNKVANNLTFETVAGKRVMMFDGVQVKVLDGIVETEALVSGTFAAI